MQNKDVSTRVCKKAFFQIHGVSNGRLDRAVRAQQVAGGSPTLDKRDRTMKDDTDFAHQVIPTVQIT